MSMLFPKTIDNYKKIPENFASQEQRRKIKIVVIDDEGLDSALKRVLGNNGFVIDELSDITSVSQLHAYSIVLCDIRGIGIGISPEYQGAGLVKAIKEEYPTKYVISFTGSDIDKRYNDMLRYADASITKDANIQEWIDKLNDAVQYSLDPVKQWNRIRTYLSQSKVPTRMIICLEDNYVRHLDNPEIKFPSKKCLKSIPFDIVQVLMNIIIPVALKGLGA